MKYVFISGIPSKEEVAIGDSKAFSRIIIADLATAIKTFATQATLEEMAKILEFQDECFKDERDTRLGPVECCSREDVVTVLRGLCQR